MARSVRSNSLASTSPAVAGTNQVDHLGAPQGFSTFMVFRVALSLILLFEIVSFRISSAIAQTSTLPDSLSETEFGALIQDLSGVGRDFHTDNFTSNESTYLNPLPILRRHDLSRGVYVGVGPEQNFSYIGAIQPTMAFIVDIRRNNMLQHLMYKALFALSDTRAVFLSKLLSKPLYEDLPRINRLFRRTPAWIAGGREASIGELVEYFDSVAPDPDLYDENIKQIKELVKVHGVDNANDMSALEYIYRAFYQRQLDIRYDLLGSDGKQLREAADLRDLLQATTTDGEPASFLANDHIFSYLREMQSRNLIVPVVGDFGGDHALRAIAEYVKAHEATISVFYTSNVESYLIAEGYTRFLRYIANIERFPIDETSVFIRSFANDSDPLMKSHPERSGNHPFTTLVQPISILLEDKPWDELRRFDLYRYIVTTGNLK